MVCQNRRRPVVSLVYWLSGGRLRDFACDPENVCNGRSIVGLHDGRCDSYPCVCPAETSHRKCHPDLSAAPEMKIGTLPDLVLPLHPIKRATLCNRSERSVRSGLHSTYFRWETGGSFRTSPISSVLGAGVSMPKPTSSKNRSESVPLQVPSDCPRLGCGAWF